MSKSDFHRISLDDHLQVGHPVPWDIYDTNEKLLVRKGFVPQSERQLEALIQRGIYTTIEEYAHSRESQDEPVEQEKKPQHRVLSMLGHAHSIIQNITLGVIARTPLPETPAEVMKVVGILDEVTSINPDIALAYILFKRTAEGYANHHMMDAAILSMAVARSMGKSQEELAAITAAALTMNIGMVGLQEDLQNREEPPTEEEKTQIFNHPALAAQLLQEAGVTDENWLSFVLHHHENIDGSGYHVGKSGDDIPEGAQIIALADRYTAMIAPRRYRKAMHPSQALRTMLIEGGKTCDVRIAATLIKELGIYPPGSCVKLVNGETGIVMRKGFSAMDPAVLIIKNQYGTDLPYPQKRDTGTDRLAIKEPRLLEPKDIPFTMQQLWGSEAI